MAGKAHDDQCSYRVVYSLKVASSQELPVLHCKFMKMLLIRFVFGTALDGISRVADSRE